MSEYIVQVGDVVEVLDPEALEFDGVDEHRFLTVSEIHHDGDQILYIVENPYGFEILCYFFTDRDLKNGYLRKVSPVVAGKKVMYCVDDVLAAAKYLSKNNTLLDQEPEEIYRNIIRDMHLCVKEDWEKTSVGGYTVSKSYIGDDLYECSVTVSPNFDLDLVYTTEKVV